VIFQSRKALDHLLRHGAIFTFRVCKIKTGKDWVTDRRGGRKIADVVVEEEGEFAPSNLGLYVEYSGFRALGEWTEEICRLNKRLPEKGWLYKVTLVR
jgi:hypothetical protein